MYISFVHALAFNADIYYLPSQELCFSWPFLSWSCTHNSDQKPTISQSSKDQLIQSLRTHRVNTITELRRIEKILAYLDSADVTEPMTTAWAHYVELNNLLNELRGLTKNHPFSSECMDEAKTLVVRDPNSARSWNYCWLVLVKMEKELVPIPTVLF